MNMQVVGAGQGSLPGPPLPTPSAALPQRLTAAWGADRGLLLALDARHVTGSAVHSICAVAPAVKTHKCEAPAAEREVDSASVQHPDPPAEATNRRSSAVRFSRRVASHILACAFPIGA